MVVNNLKVWLSLKSNKYTNSREIENMTGIKPICIRIAVQSLRSQGMPIIASNRGYKIAHDIVEVEKYVLLRKIEISKEIDTLTNICNSYYGYKNLLSKTKTY